MRFAPEQKAVYRRKKTIRLNPISMGIANFMRDRKRTISIVVSFSLGGIILFFVSSVLLTRSPMQCARRWFSDGDYKIYLNSEQSEEEIMMAGNPLNEKLKQEILSIDGITEVLTTRQAIHADVNYPLSKANGLPASQTS